MKSLYMDWFCGIKSNIPICCVIFYNFIYGHIPAEFQLKYIKILNPKYQYIPCPFCIIERKMNEIKSCNWSRCMGKRIRCEL